MPTLMQGSLMYAVAAAEVLIAALWQGLLLAAVVSLALKVGPRLTAAVRSLVWTAVFLLLVGLHGAPVLRHFLAHGASNGAAWAPLGQVSPVAHVAAQWALPLLGLWIVLSLVRLSRLAASAVRLHGVLRRAVPLVASPGCASLLQAGGRAAVLCRSAEVDRPSVAGFFPPRILIPADLLETLPESRLQQIVLHEMEHLRRRDDWTNLLQKLALAVFPLNPGLWWVERRLCLERELACDDGVLRATRARKAYAACLASLAEHRLVRRGLSLTLGAWGRPSELSQRVLRLLGAPLVTGTRSMAASAAVLVLAAGGGAALLARSPELVSFAAPAPSIMAYAPPALAGSGGHAGWRSDGPGLLPAAARMDAGGGARMIPAVATMPAKTVTAEPIRDAGGVQRRTRRSRVPRRTTVLQGQQRQLVMGGRRPGSDVGPRLQLTRAVVSTVSGGEGAGVPRQSLVFYAAVPTPDGWLILQL